MGVSFFKARVEGVSALLVHNIRLADPTDPLTRAISEIHGISQKKRTTEDDVKLRELSWKAGLYYDDDIGPFVPDKWIEGVIREGAKKVKKALSKSTVAGVIMVEEKAPLIYDGPRGIDDLYSLTANGLFYDWRPVGLQNGKIKVMRIRPRFNPPWGCEFTLRIFTDVVNPTDIEKSLIQGGSLCGIGDYKPKYGLFTVKEFKEVKKAA